MTGDTDTSAPVTLHTGQHLLRHRCVGHTNSASPAAAMQPWQCMQSRLTMTASFAAAGGLVICKYADAVLGTSYSRVCSLLLECFKQQIPCRYGLQKRGKAYLTCTWLMREQTLAQVQIIQSMNQYLQRCYITNLLCCLVARL